MAQESHVNQLGVLALALATAQTEAAQRASGLGVSACAVIVTLGPYPGMTIGELARIAGLSHSVMVRGIEALTARGLVTRVEAQDRRAVALALTQAGEATRSAILTARRAALHQALEPLATAEQDLLGRLIGRLLDQMTTGRAQADHFCRLCDEAACGPDCPVELAARRIDGASQ